MALDLLAYALFSQVMSSNGSYSPQPGHAYPASSDKLLLAHKLPALEELEERKTIIRRLQSDLEDTLRLPCYFPKSGSGCYEFRYEFRGSKSVTLVAVFLYRTELNKEKRMEEPNQLHRVVYLQKMKPATIIDYKPAISTKPEFWEKFWRNPHNISDVGVDYDRTIKNGIMRIFEECLEQIPKFNQEERKQQLRKLHVFSRGPFSPVTRLYRKTVPKG